MSNESKSDTIDCSIIVCTYNRAESLADTLQCLGELDSPPGLSWEVLIVDNNSTDLTHTTIESAKQNLAGQLDIHYIFEKNQGLAHARNRGINEAKGELLLFTDDDVLPEQDWLQQIWDCMSKYACDACGGYIAPLWETSPPPWLTDKFHGFLAIKMDEEGPKPIQKNDELPFGANMAFRRDVFEKVSVFDVNRGRKGNILASGEDGELYQRILAAKLKVMYFPQARVRHKVEAFRVKRKYFRRWRYQSSRNIAQSKGVSGKRRLMGIPLYMFPQLMRAMTRALVARVTLPADEAFYKEILVWHFLGFMAGLRQAHHDQQNNIRH